MNVSNSKATRSKHGPRGGPELFQRCPETGLVRSCVRAGHAAFPDKICSAKTSLPYDPESYAQRCHAKCDGWSGSLREKAPSGQALRGYTFLRAFRAGQGPFPDKICSAWSLRRALNRTALELEQKLERQFRCARPHRTTRSSTRSFATFRCGECALGSR